MGLNQTAVDTTPLQLRKLPALEALHEFIKRENDVGAITRQEAVSMVRQEGTGGGGEERGIGVLVCCRVVGVRLLGRWRKAAQQGEAWLKRCGAA